VIWVSHFVLFRSLGLYEDDYAIVSEGLGWTLGDLRGYMRVIATWPEGRPLHYLLPHVLAFLAGQAGGLSTAYILAYVVQAANAFLFYWLLRRLGLTKGALPGALAFGLFPADTTHTLLVHAFGQHTSLTFLLVAVHLFLSDKRSLAYLSSVGSLLTFESAYMVFLAVPLLSQPWDRRLLKAMLRHAAIWLSLLGLAVLVRIVVGEERMMTLGSSPGSVTLALSHIVIALWMGPAVSLASFWAGPAWTLTHWRWELSVVFSACFVLCLLSFGHWRSGAGAARPESHALPHIELFHLSHNLALSDGQRQAIRLALVSLPMISIAYGLSFTHFPPTVTYGRLTSVHLAATFGAALLFASVWAFLLDIDRPRWVGPMVTGLLSVYLSVLVAYRFAIQLDFRQAWANQRQFWTQVVALCPDLNNRTMIFVPNHDLATTRFILTHSWADPIVLPQLYGYGRDWAHAPRLFVVPVDWTQSVVREGQQLLWQVPAATWEPHWEALPDGNIILLEMEGGRLVRRSGFLRVGGQDLHLKPATSTDSRLPPHGLLYDYMILR